MMCCPSIKPLNSVLCVTFQLLKFNFLTFSGVRSCYDEGKRTAETLTMDYHRGGGVEVNSSLCGQMWYLVIFFYICY